MGSSFWEFQAWEGFDLKYQFVPKIVRFRRGIRFKKSRAYKSLLGVMTSAGWNVKRRAARFLVKLRRNIAEWVVVYARWLVCTVLLRDGSRAAIG